MKNDDERQTQKECKTIIYKYKPTGDVRQAATSSVAGIHIILMT